MLTPVRSTQFNRDVRRAEKRGKNMAKLRVLLVLLIQQEPVSARYLDHPLRGTFKGYRRAQGKGGCRPRCGGGAAFDPGFGF